MLKKLIAGIASVTLALGMVALTASPASAHTPAVSADCKTVSVDLKDYNKDETNHVWVYLDGALVAEDANFGKGFKGSYPFAGNLLTHTYQVVVTVYPSTQWNWDSGVLSVTNCLADDTKSKKIDICHHNEGNGWVAQTVTVESILQQNGHAYHQGQQDLIPEFDYVSGGSPQHFGGLNLGGLGQFYLDHGCDNVDVDPTPPGIVDSECSYEGGEPSIPTYTIPAIVGVKYQVKVDDGDWEDVAAGNYVATPGSTYDFQALALPGYTPALTEFDSHKFSIVSCIGDVKVVGDPVFHDAFCQLDGNFPVAGTFEVVAALHVNYTVSINGVLPPAVIATGTHTANPGDHVEIWAHADAGWALDENLQSYWEHTFGPAVDCSLTPPSLTCLLFDEEGGITLPAIPHVKWIIDGEPAVSGEIWVQLAILDTHIQAVADSGYAFSAGTTSWTFGLDENGVCEFPTFATISTNVTHTDQVCRSGVAGGGTVTVGLVEGESFFDGTNYYLDGSVIPMATPTVAVGAGAHTVTASLKDLDDTFEVGSELSWSFTVLAPATCDLTTLALTGTGSNPIGWAGIGYYLLITGLALIAVRTVRRRNEVKQ